MSINLSARLREGTKKAHTMAENVGFVKCFLKGTVEKKSYRTLVSNLYFVYSALEEEMERHSKHNILSKIYFSELNRKSSLESDLNYYYGPNWKGQISPSPAAQVYVQRIHELGSQSPELLIAHCYTRYLGDLSGGQILKNIAQTAMRLSDGNGTAFYEFEQIADEKEFKVNYRHCLDSLPITEADAVQIVDEANDAFGMNMALFNELEGNLIAAIGKMLFNSLTQRKQSKNTTLATAE
ncbi:MAG: heme oxygenase (biliverdin-producing) [Thermosynechococcaceae cyanobacterium]